MRAKATIGTLVLALSVSGAAGLPDVAIRSTQGGVNEAGDRRVGERP